MSKFHKLNPLMPGGNKKVTQTQTNVQALKGYETSCFLCRIIHLLQAQSKESERNHLI